MKTHLYKVTHPSGSTSLEDVFKQIEPLPLASRNRDLNGYTNRIENIEFRRLDNSHCVVVNFVKIRMRQGPGRAGLKRATTGFNLGSDEGFAEETAALFDLDHNSAIVEYNHHGARANILADYLGSIKPDSEDRFELLPELDSQIMQKLQRMQTISKFEVKVAPQKIDASSKQNLLGMGGAFRAAEQINSPTVAITFGGAQGLRAKFNDTVWPIISQINDWIKVDDADVTVTRDSERAILSAKVIGKEDDNDPSVLLDLVKGRVFGFHDISAGADRRLPLDERWNALARDHIAWRKNIRS